MRPGEEAQVDIALTQGVRITGSLLADGKPVVGAVVVAVEKQTDGKVMVSIDSDDTQSRTRGDGRFVVGVAPGSYMLLFLDLQGGQGPVARREIEVSGDEPVVDLGVVTAGEGEGMDPGPGPQEEDVDVGP